MKELKWATRMHFAFDSMGDLETVISGIGMLKDAGINIRRNLRVYVYLHNREDKRIDDAIERCRILKSLDATALVMFNIEEKENERVKVLRRWTGRPQLYWSMDIADYERRLEKCSRPKTM